MWFFLSLCISELIKVFHAIFYKLEFISRWHFCLKIAYYFYRLLLLKLLLLFDTELNQRKNMWIKRKNLRSITILPLNTRKNTSGNERKKNIIESQKYWTWTHSWMPKSHTQFLFFKYFILWKMRTTKIWIFSLPKPNEKKIIRFN